MAQHSNLKSELQQLDSYDFEKLVADLWAKQGWETRVLQASKDRGIDVEARRADPFEQKHLIQAKRYSEGNKVGSEEVQQYASLREQGENVDAVVVITTSDFTQQAKSVGSDLNLKMVNGDDLVQLIQDQDATELVEEYLSSEHAEVDDEGDFPINGSLPQPTLNPDDVPNIYIQKLVDSAQGSLVTENRLSKLKTGMTFSETPTEQPIIGHLYKEEQPHYTLLADKVRLPNRGVLEPENQAYLVLTDQRILIILGTEREDIDIPVSYRKVKDVSAIHSLTSRKLEFETEEGIFRFKMSHFYLSESGASSMEDIMGEIKSAAQYIREMAYSKM